MKYGTFSELSKLSKPKDTPITEKNLQVVRLKTSAYINRSGIHFVRSLLTQKHLSSGYQLLTEDCPMIGAEIVLNSITNLNECEDGLYEVHTCNHQYDWESGYLDSYDYKLVPYTNETGK